MRSLHCGWSKPVRRAADFLGQAVLLLKDGFSGAPIESLRSLRPGLRAALHRIWLIPNLGQPREQPRHIAATSASAAGFRLPRDEEEPSLLRSRNDHTQSRLRHLVP